MKSSYNFFNLFITIILILSCQNSNENNNALVFMSDFGLKDGAVAEMKGVANEISPQLKTFDITHEIPEYNIFEGAYRLLQTVPYWKKGTVFVCVVDPGVGTSRKSIVLKTKNEHYLVGPDNGLFSLIAEKEGVEEVREIDEKTNRRAGSGDSHTFFGRDVFAYTGARIASKKIGFKDMGKEFESTQLVKLNYQKPTFKDGIIKGAIPVLDVQYGNVWSNIDEKTLKNLNLKVGETINCKIFNGKELKFEGKIPFQNTFGEVREGENLCYLNSLMNFSIAINMGNFSAKYKVYSGEGWFIEITK